MEATVCGVGPGPRKWCVVGIGIEVIWWWCRGEIGLLVGGSPVIPTRLC